MVTQHDRFRSPGIRTCRRSRKKGREPYPIRDVKDLAVHPCAGAVGGPASDLTDQVTNAEHDNRDEELR